MSDKLEVIRSPFHYMGNKKKVLQNGLKAFLYEALEGNGGHLFDMMVGSGSVLYNSPHGGWGFDINKPAIMMHVSLQRHDAVERILGFYNRYFPNGDVTEDSYYRLRQMENRFYESSISPSKKEPFYFSFPDQMAILYVLTQLAFNSLMRFGPRGYNAPFGHNQKEFSIERIARAAEVSRRLGLKFMNQSFIDMDLIDLMVEGIDVAYFDPPYFITSDQYEYAGWPQWKEYALRAQLGLLNERNRRFILSNVARYRGHNNSSLIKFAERSGFYIYRVPTVKYQAWSNVGTTDQSKSRKTVEVLITNIETDLFEQVAPGEYYD